MASGVSATRLVCRTALPHARRWPGLRDGTSAFAFSTATTATAASFVVVVIIIIVASTLHSHAAAARRVGQPIRERE